MQALIAATREMARSTRTTVDSIGMTPDRLTGILSRLDRIEANALGLDAAPEHPRAGEPPAQWR